ncbi:MAG: thioredoxin domain-containing protein [Aquisalimonadaceae bacterium]
MTDASRLNHLAHCTSPYLLQHADNPVDWYPWVPAALQQAQQKNLPILLSIGYSACHWCHVMAHESFEDPDIAAVMNRHFVNIKVDREERPDLDRIYQLAHQLLTGRAGGWPLTMFLDPESHLPFFGGTYFPSESRQGLPGFIQVLERVEEVFRKQRDEIRTQNASMQTALNQFARAPGGASEALDPAPMTKARDVLTGAFDAQHGGFSDAPKFPQPVIIQRLLRDYAARRDRHSLHMACLTLRRMALGGLFDQVGGGFARYSVDDYWMIPHFEKMLSDNGLLLSLYVDAWHATGDDLYARVARETARWAIREMRTADGGFQAALDADSEGTEGRFYTWTPEEVRRQLNDEQYALAEKRFGLDDEPNFEGRWHFHVYASLSELGKVLRRPKPEVEALLASVTDILYEARSRRVWPGQDGKILASWNALMIRALARAGRLLKEPDMVEAADDALAFIRKHLWRDDRLLASWKDGEAGTPGYLDDYAFLLDAILELLQTRWRNEDLALAVQLADNLLAYFEDREAGGFFFTAHDHEALIQRPRPLTDDATPSGNGIAALALQRLGCLLGETRYLDAAERTVRAAWKNLQDMPHAHLGLLDALDEILEPPRIVIIRATAAQLPGWQQEAERYYNPRRLTFPIPDTVTPPSPLETRKPQDGGRAWICQGLQCFPPADSVQELREQLDRTTVTHP